MGKSGLSSNRIFYEFDPFEEAGIKPPKDAESAKEEIGDFVKEQVLQHIASGSSPVAGGDWKRSLSKSYKKEKAKYSSVSYANLELKGDMLDALDVVDKRGNKLSLEITGSTEVAKADGHNNFSGKSSLPKRQFIPESDETFKRAIIDGIKKIAKRHGK